MTRPSGLGGEMPHTLGDDEGVAAEDDGDVVVPAGKTSSELTAMSNAVPTEFPFCPVEETDAGADAGAGSLDPDASAGDAG